MFLILLFILFLGLKLGAVITWSWWIVFLPLIAKVTLFTLKTVFVEAFKLQRPWAVKLYLWLKF